MQLEVIFELSDGGGFTAYVPAHRVASQKAIRSNRLGQDIREEIELYLEPLDGSPLPLGAVVEKIVV